MKKGMKGKQVEKEGRKMDGGRRRWGLQSRVFGVPIS